MIHELKIKPEYFASVVSGDKTFEIRNNSDRNFQVGDTLLLWEWNGGFTGQTAERTVSYITDFEQKPGYVVLGLANKREQELAEQLADATRQCGVMADMLRDSQRYVRYHLEHHECDARIVMGLISDIDTAMAGKLPAPTDGVTETIRTAPERIWLQVGDQTGDGDHPFPEHHDEVTWCADSVVACEVPYVRADLAGNIPAPVGGEMRTVTVSGKGLLELVDFTCPDHETDREQQETEIVLLNREAFTSTDGEKMPRGVYAYLAEYPEEGLYGPVGCQEQHGDKSLNQNPAATAGQSAPTVNKQPSLTGQVLAGMGAATLLAGLDKESASDVVQLMLEAAEAKGGGSCATEPPSSSQA